MSTPAPYIACQARGEVHIRTAGTGRRTFCGYTGLSVDLKRAVTPTLLSYCCRKCSIAYMTTVEKRKP